MLNRRIVAAMLLSVAMLVAPARADDNALTPHTALYEVRIRMVSGELSTRLSRSGDRYVAQHRVDPTGFARMLVKGSIEESATFELADDRLQPLRYTSSDTISSDGTQADLAFDAAARRIAGDLNGEKVTIDYEGDAFDRISIQYAMMHDLVSGQSSDAYRLFDIDEFKTLTITQIGTQEVEVPAGRYEAVGIRHQARGSSRVTTLWCVPALDYLPAIIEQHRKGKLNFRATLASYTPD